MQMSRTTPPKVWQIHLAMNVTCDGWFNAFPGGDNFMTSTRREVCSLPFHFGFVGKLTERLERARKGVVHIG